MTVQALSAEYASLGWLRAVRFIPGEAYSADKAECLAQGVGGWNYSIFQIDARVRGSSPETLSSGWLRAVRFIPSETVSGELPPTVVLRSPFFA